MISAVIASLIFFKVGVLVGYKKAQYTYRWGENYHRNFAGPKGGFFQDFKRGFKDRDFINAHGTFGMIIQIDFSASTGQVVLVIRGKDDFEKTVMVSSQTAIRSRKEILAARDLKIDDRVVIIGSPNEQGQIEARLIRVFPFMKYDTFR